MALAVLDAQDAVDAQEWCLPHPQAMPSHCSHFPLEALLLGKVVLQATWMPQGYWAEDTGALISPCSDSGE